MIFKQQLFKPVYNGTVLVPKPNTEAGETLTVKEKKEKKFRDSQILTHIFVLQTFMLTVNTSK